MASAQRFCNPCSADEVESSAVNWCNECEEALCLDCTKAHSRVKLTKLHHLIELANLPSMVSSMSIGHKSCEKHVDFQLDFFCTYHSVICCKHCMAETHRTCKDVLPLEVTSKNVRESPLFDDVNKEINHFVEAVDKLETLQNDSEQSLDMDENKIKQNVKEFKSHVIKHIDELEESLMQKLVQVKKDHKTKLGNQKAKLKKLAEFGNPHKRELTFLLDHGSNNQLFMLIQNLQVSLHEKGQELQQTAVQFQAPTVSLDKDENLIKNMKSLGTLKSGNRQTDLSFTPVKDLQAQTKRDTVLKTPEIILNSKFVVKFEDVRRCIAGMSIIEGDMLLLCDNNNKTVLKCTTDGKIIKTCSLEGYVWNVALIPNTEKAVVSLSNTNSIQFIDYRNMMAREMVSLSHDCYGLAVSEGKIFVGWQNVMSVLDLNGTFKKKYNYKILREKFIT